MNSDELRAQLQQAGAGLDSEMRIVADGRVVCCVGLLATFYVLQGDQEHVREAFAKALELYLASVGDRMVWGGDPFSGKAQRIAGTEIANVRTWMSRIGPREQVQVVMHGGQQPSDADPYRVVAVVGARRPPELSYFSFGLPFDWIATHPAGAFVQLILHECNILAPSSGYAGLAVIPHVDISRQSPDMGKILALVARFRGLEVDLPGSHAIYMEQENRTKGINWLTILDGSWLAQLGGDDAVKAAVGPGVQWHPFKTGALIQAGPRPLFGDLHRQEPMPQYEQIARALKPIRATSLRAIATPYGFDRDRSDEWLRRFDG
jgi:hypothetical protein